MIKYFSAFAGIGGFDLGIERAIPDAECIGISEVNKHAIKIYEKHYPDRVNFGDIRKIKTKDLPDFDLFCGGFPCQTFSIAGKRAGLCGERGSLFFEIIRIVRKKQPRYILLENVKGLLSSNKGWDFARILVELEDAGYSVEWAVYNSKNFGVPQNRQRVFIIGYSGGECGSKIFPIGEGAGDIDESGEQPGHRLVSNAIDSNYYKGPDGKRQLIQLTETGTPNERRVYDSSGIARTIKATCGGWGAKTGLYSINSQAIAIGHSRDKRGKASYHPLEIFGTLKQQSGNQTNYVVCINSQPRCGDPAKGGTGLLISEENSFTLNRNPQIICDSGLSRKTQVRTEVMPPLRANTGAAYNNTVVTTSGVNWTSKGIEPRKDGLAATIKPQNGNQCPTAIINRKIRRLTPLEAERLQGFPEMWTAFGSDDKPISDTQRYKCLGNAVTVPVIEAIMTAIREKWG